MRKIIWRLLISSFAILLLGAATASKSVAQTNGVPSKLGTRLITLGTTAGPPPRAHRAQSSNLLIVNGTLYVIDAGDGAARRIVKAGFNVRDIGVIFITHHHDDHTAGVGTLMSLAWDNQRTKPINVYGPPETADLIRAAVQYFTISAETAGSRSERTMANHDRR
jgi:ribonuclease BN (tRNA processing enzyme)